MSFLTSKKREKLENARLVNENKILLAEITNLRQQLESAKEKIAKKSKVLNYQRSKANVFVTIFHVINVLKRLADDLFGENSADIIVFGSGVRVLFEFLADQLDEKKTHYGNPFIRDIDIRIMARENVFKQIRNFLEAYSITNSGKIEGLSYVFLNVSPISTKKTNNVEITYFTITLYNQEDDSSFYLDVSKHHDRLGTNDYNINRLQISRAGITSQSGEFLEVIESILHRQARPLFAAEERTVSHKMLTNLLRQMKINGYEIAGNHYPLLRREDIIYGTPNAISIEMKGCLCTVERFLSLEALIQYKGKRIKCPFCRKLFTGPVILNSPPKRIQFNLNDNNPFLIKPNHEEKKNREALIQQLKLRNNFHRNPIIVDGEPVKIEEIQPIINLMRGNTERDRCTCSRCNTNYHISS